MSTKPADFREWLLLHADESSDIGHLAYDVRDDTTWPATPAKESFEFYESYLASQGAIAQAHAALATAWSRYTSGQS